jgi:hypothetical protein
MKLNTPILTLSMFAFTACGPVVPQASVIKSLSGDGFEGKKFYFGWGAAASGDPTMMHNEVKFDVLHTHDIFTAEVGGSYQGIKEIGTGVNRSKITSRWGEVGSQMGSDDMFVQYSSGHGFETGLAVGVSYDDIRNNALAYPAKEIIIFTMACKSGGLVDSFNRRRSDWQSWNSTGRQLLVMSSSKTTENSSTGPGRDPEEPNGASGSAGSAYGHALWKALIGYSDGYIDGVKDGYLTLDEIVEFTKWKTIQVGGHYPTVTGSYSGSLIMNRVPSRAFIESLGYTSEGMTDEEIREQIERYDMELAQYND